ncbi:uncharacterized protein [Physcomitrium patens]|uniref:DUF4378 domain-containing protein n=1 Tax=Physcomitrium patens TaxID=3218 RepID=A0A2K1ISE6_PHYPA|nr:uncharacterized protein LOC112274438 isoform X1 [Physcomitrium patens]PNR32194.1 hypothetical protein PHYPA_026320 [Physcomitrium patens]|eukprot:XP_024359714.1 uncharacterized protein LOC112274438 isoform X1 [Physcomitrella patens]
MNMAADKAEDPPELLETLAENRITFEKQIGCLAGLLQIFHCQCTLNGHRKTSNRLRPVHEETSLQAHDILRHDAGSPAIYLRSGTKPARSRTAMYEANMSVEEWPSINKKEIPPEEIPPSRVSFYFENQPGRASPRRASPRHSPVHPKNLPLFPAQRRMSSDRRPSYENFPKSPDSSIIRNVVLNSLHKEKSRVSVDNSSRETMAGLIRLKNLARSRSVGGRNASARAGAEFPRSNSLGEQRSLEVYSDCIEEPLGFLARERITSNLIHLRRSVDSREISRLTVELEEGPGVGSFKDRRQKFVDDRSSHLNNFHKHESDAARQAALDLEKSLYALNLKESFRTFQKDKTYIHRSLVSGDVRRSPQAAAASKIGGRSPRREQMTRRVDFEGRCGGTNVVARLMGLEELSVPSTRMDLTEAGATDMNSKSLSADTEHGKCDEYRHGSYRGRYLSRKHRLMDGMPSRIRQQEVREALKSKITKSKNYFHEEGPLLTIQGCKSPTSTHEPLHDDIMQRLQQLRSWNATEEREILSQILETLQLKGLLHLPRSNSREAADRVTRNIPTQMNSDEVNVFEYRADSGHDWRKFSTRQDSSLKHPATIMIMRPSPTKMEVASMHKHADCKCNGSESSERSEATSTRLSNEDRVCRGSAKHVREKIRSPARSSRPLPRMKDNARSTSPKQRRPPQGEEGQSWKVSLPVKAMSSISNTPSQLPQARLPRGQAPHLRDKKESKAALVTLRGQSHGTLKKCLAAKNCEAQTARNSVETTHRKRSSRTANKAASPTASRYSTPCRDNVEDRIASETRLDKKKFAEGTHSPAHEAALKETDYEDWKKECKARVTAGGAMDHSVVNFDHDPCVDRHALNSSPARLRAKLQTLKDCSDVKAAPNELKAPQGSPAEKTQTPDQQQGLESCDQHSPVSVLDNSVFDAEDSSPSPPVTTNVQDSHQSEGHEYETRVEDGDRFAITPSTSVETKHVTYVPPAERGEPRDLHAEMHLPIDHITSCDEGINSSLSRDNLVTDFVGQLLVMSGAARAEWSSGMFVSGQLYANHENHHEWLSKFEAPENAYLFNKCHRQLLIDFTIEVLTTKLAENESAETWLEPSWARTEQQHQFKRQSIENIIWKELQDLPCTSSYDICDAVQGILQKDFGSQGPKWTGFRTEVGEVGVEVEKMIYKDLMDEVVRELKCFGSCRHLTNIFEGGSGPRRQLFTS